MAKQYSVIIPAYNAEKTILRALKSVIDQSLAPFEIIVVDDHSTDSTVDVVLKHFRDRVSIINLEKNCGAAAARNIGVQRSSCDYIAFLDADDEWLSDKMAIQLKTLNNIESENLNTVIYSGFFLSRGSCFRNKEVKPITPTSDFASRLFLRGGAILPSSVLLKKLDFLSVGGFDPNIPSGHDRDLWIRLAMKFNFYLIKSPLLIKHVTLNSLAANYDKKFANEILSMSKLIEMFPQLKPLARNRMANMLANRAAYRLKTGRTGESLKDCISSLLQNPLNLRTYKILLALSAPSFFNTHNKKSCHNSRDA